MADSAGWISEWIRCLVVLVLAAGVHATAQAVPADNFDLAAYRQRVAEDRAAGIAEGRAVLRSGRLDDDPIGERTLLWYMGGAAVGMPDDQALAEVVDRLERLSVSAGDPVAASYAGFLRGARQIDLGNFGVGLLDVLRAANRLMDNPDPKQRIVGASELCRAYISVGKLSNALRHCQRHLRLVGDSDDPMAIARAEYMLASAFSIDQQPADAIPLWRSARKRFADGGMDVLAGRAAGSMAGDLVAVRRFDEALVLAREAIREAKKAGNPISVAIARGMVAEALQGMGRTSEGLVEINLAIDEMESIDQPTVLADLLQRKLAILSVGGDQAAIDALQERLASLVVHPVDPDENEVISTMEQRLRQREQDLRIKELENENRHRELELEASRLAAERSQRNFQTQREITLLAGLAVAALLFALAAAALLLRSQRKLAATLRRQAHYDPLTDLPNRRALYEAAEAILAAPDAAGRGHALLMLDLDHFKDVNDTGGHPFGDSVLIAVARCLQAHQPSGGMVGRLGGEEFVILAPDLGADGARRLAEQVCSDVRGLDIRFGGHRLAVTVSVGFALYDGLVCHNLSSWLARADSAVYQAKLGGRDRVES